MVQHDSSSGIGVRKDSILSFSEQNEGGESVCESCFLKINIINNRRIPKRIRNSYLKRKWKFTIDRKKAGEIKHVDFHYHKHPSLNRVFWTGVEQVEFDNPKRTEYRFCYWANIGKGWKWGQFAPFFRTDVLQKVLKEMEK